MSHGKGLGGGGASYHRDRSFGGGGEAEAGTGEFVAGRFLYQPTRPGPSNPGHGTASSPSMPPTTTTGAAPTYDPKKPYRYPIEYSLSLYSPKLSMGLMQKWRAQVEQQLLKQQQQQGGEAGECEEVDTVIPECIIEPNPAGSLPTAHSLASPSTSPFPGYPREEGIGGRGSLSLRGGRGASMAGRGASKMMANGSFGGTRLHPEGGGGGANSHTWMRMGPQVMQSTEEPLADDIWDMPTGDGGGFDSNGVFSLISKKSAAPMAASEGGKSATGAAAPGKAGQPLQTTTFPAPSESKMSGMFEQQQQSSSTLQAPQNPWKTKRAVPLLDEDTTEPARAPALPTPFNVAAVLEDLGELSLQSHVPGPQHHHHPHHHHQPQHHPHHPHPHPLQQQQQQGHHHHQHPHQIMPQPQYPGQPGQPHHHQLHGQAPRYPLLHGNHGMLALPNPMWVYQDPAGRIQGPFTPNQMHEWYKNNYFHDMLPIKHLDDPQFRALGSFVQSFGPDRPFLMELELLSAAAVGGSGGGMGQGLARAPQQQQQHMGQSRFFAVSQQPTPQPTPQQQLPPQEDSRMSLPMGGSVEQQQHQSALHAQQGRQQAGVGMMPAEPVPRHWPQAPKPQLPQPQPNSWQLPRPEQQGMPQPQQQQMQPAQQQQGTLALSGVIGQPLPQPAVGASASPRAASPKVSSAPISAPAPGSKGSKSSPAILPAAAPTSEGVQEKRRAAPAPATPSASSATGQEKRTNTAAPAAAAAPRKASVGPVWGMVGDAQQQQGDSLPATTRSPSLTDIQQAEMAAAQARQKQQAQQARERMMAEELRLQAAQQGATTRAIPPTTAWAAAPVPGSAANAGTLTEIMKQEEASVRKVREAAATTAASRRYAELAASAKSSSSASLGGTATPPWGKLSASTISVATGPLLKPAPSSKGGSASSLAAVGGTAEGAPAMSRQASATSKGMAALASAAVPAPTSAERAGPGVPSETFLGWCRHALSDLEKGNDSVKVNDFISILLSIPLSEPGTVMMICDDTLGGVVSINPRKFGEEFLKRRRQDHFDGLQGGPAPKSRSLPPSPLLPAPLESFAASSNKFVMVGKGGKKGKKSAK